MYKRKYYFVISVKSKKFKNPNVSYICNKTMVLSTSCVKFDNNSKDNLLDEEESTDTLKLKIINNKLVKHISSSVNSIQRQKPKSFICF